MKAEALAYFTGRTIGVDRAPGETQHPKPMHKLCHVIQEGSDCVKTFCFESG
jgi:hypothetical protein